MRGRRATRKRGAQLWYCCSSSCPSSARCGCRSTTRVEPRLGGVPYFYWYQFVWIGIGAAITAVVYFATREPER